MHISEAEVDTVFLFTVEHDSLVVKYRGTNGGDVTRRVRSAKDLRDFLVSKAAEAGVSVEDLVLMKSSSLDFPETTNPKTLKLIELLAG